MQLRTSSPRGLHHLLWFAIIALLFGCAKDQATFRPALAGFSQASILNKERFALLPGSAIALSIETRRTLPMQEAPASPGVATAAYLARQGNVSDSDVREFNEGAKSELSQRFREAGYIVIDLSGNARLLAKSPSAALALIPASVTVPAYLLQACIPLAKSYLIKSFEFRYSFNVPVLYVSRSDHNDQCLANFNGVDRLRPQFGNDLLVFTLAERSNIGATFSLDDATQQARDTTTKLTDVRPLSPREFGRHWAKALVQFVLGL